MQRNFLISPDLNGVLQHFVTYRTSMHLRKHSFTQLALKQERKPLALIPHSAGVMSFALSGSCDPVTTTTRVRADSLALGFLADMLYAKAGSTHVSPAL